MLWSRCWSCAEGIADCVGLATEGSALFARDLPRARAFNN